MKTNHRQQNFYEILHFVPSPLAGTLLLTDEGATSQHQQAPLKEGGAPIYPIDLVLRQFQSRHDPERALKIARQTDRQHTVTHILDSTHPPSHPSYELHVKTHHIANPANPDRLPSTRSAPLKTQRLNADQKHSPAQYSLPHHPSPPPAGYNSTPQTAAASSD
jgi:hypothetical protein